jgi:hypothetical protein
VHGTTPPGTLPNGKRSRHLRFLIPEICATLTQSPLASNRRTAIYKIRVSPRRSILESRDNTRESRANMVFVPENMVESQHNSPFSPRNTRESRHNKVESRANMVSIPENKVELRANTLYSRSVSLKSRPNTGRATGSGLQGREPSELRIARARRHPRVREERADTDSSVGAGYSARIEATRCRQRLSNRNEG